MKPLTLNNRPLSNMRISDTNKGLVHITIHNSRMTADVLLDKKFVERFSEWLSDWLQEQELTVQND